MERLLHALMARRMGETQHLLTKIVVVRNEDAAPVEKQAVG